MARHLPPAKTLLGAVVRTCAEEEGSVDVLALRVGVSRSTLDALLRNTGTPTAATFAKLAAYLELPIDTLWSWHTVRECC